MDINDVRGLGSIFALIAFLAVLWWAYGPQRKNRFEDDGDIPFREEDDAPAHNENKRSK
ncbi:MAG: cbb3-type cytochrome c oxidase subunit 3 [Oleibacter sp.]|nr:cbb3-type cytochrome c oxidase subunit 3 [Thalassolituus sp.]